MLFKSAMGVAASIFTLFVVELVVFAVLAGRFGSLAVVALTVGLSVLGVRLLVRHTPTVISESVRTMTAAPGHSNLADGALRVFAALLLAFPGILTGVAGLLLFVGPVRGLLASSLETRLSRFVPAGADGRSFWHRRDVVDVASTIKDPDRPPASARRAQAPELP